MTTLQASSKSLSRPGLLLAILAVAQLTIQIDTTIVTVALPSIQTDLGISDANRHWTVTIYAIAFGGLLLLGGRLSDWIGRKRAIVGSLVGFGLASLLGGIATTSELLYLSRGLQGAFAAVLAPGILSLISTTFVTPRERARAFAIWGGVGGLGGSIGLILGGMLTEYVSWRWTLLINTPLTLVIAAAVAVVIKDTQVAVRARLDIAGTLTSAVGISALVFGATQAEAHGWGSFETLGPIVVGLALIALFVLIEHRSKDPLLPLSVLTDRVRGSSFLAMALLAGAIFASNVLIIYYFQTVKSFTILQSGFAFLPITLAVITFATLGGRLLPIIGARVIIVSGAAAGVIGFIILGRADAHTGLPVLIPALILVGAAVGLAWPVLSATALLGIPDKDAGAAGGLINVAQQASGAITVAVLNTVAATVTATAGSLMEGLSVALLACAALLLTAAVASLALKVPATEDLVATPVE